MVSTRTKLAIYRLKSGEKLSFLDWVKLENFDLHNEHHCSLLKRVKPLIGAIDTPTPHEIKDKLEQAGFPIILIKTVVWCHRTTN